MSRKWKYDGSNIGTDKEWPCPHCGADLFWEGDPRAGNQAMHPVVCSECHVLMDMHWADGCWFGRWLEAGRPEALSQFVAEKSEQLGSADTW